MKEFKSTETTESRDLMQDGIVIGLKPTLQWDSSWSFNPNFIPIPFKYMDLIYNEKNVWEKGKGHLEMHV